MKRVALGSFALALAFAMVAPARAGNITGALALAGLDSYTVSPASVTFAPGGNTGAVMIAGGSFALAGIVAGPPSPTIVTMDDIATFTSEVGKQLFHGPDGLTFTVLADSSPKFENGNQFLDWDHTGRALVTLNGFTPTVYSFSFTSTEVSPTTTIFTLDAGVLPEPGSLVLVGTGLVGLAGLLFWKAKKPAPTLSS